ncbi:MAG: reverse transcriptase/maturase family protein [Bdellovibrionales bacterium]
MYLLPAELTLESLFDAYFDCRKHKRNTIHQLAFEADLERNLMALWRDLRDGTYQIGRSIAFVVTYPKAREVWAASFRDRIVHHLIYNAIQDRFTRRFIRDSYACIPTRGSHDGCCRISHFARSVTRNWTRPAFVLKADVASFFTSIDQNILLDIIGTRVHEDWLLKLIHQVTRHNPRQNAIFRSTEALFALVPRHKSLLYAPLDRGLPIGNLTSQFFANVYMNELDQFAKNQLGARYYGRYVDDIILFDESRDALEEKYARMESFLSWRLNLHLHPNKKKLHAAADGIDFVGFIIKPGRTYLRNMTLAHCKKKIKRWQYVGAPIDYFSLTKLACSVTTYLGMLRSVDGYRARKKIAGKFDNLFIYPDDDFTKIIVP